MLAKALGITVEELKQCDYELSEHRSRDDFLYCYYVQFDEHSPKEILDKITFDYDKTVELDIWTFENPDEYYDYYDVPSSGEEALISLKSELNDLKALTESNIEVSLKETHYRMIFSGAITVLEVYLRDVFLSLTMNHQEYFDNFLKNADKHIRLSWFIGAEDMERRLKEIVKGEIIELSFHNIKKVRQLYKNTFFINLPASEKIYAAVQKRHDFIHRNGKNVDDEKVYTDKQEILKLISDIMIFSEKLFNCINRNIK